MPDISKIKLLDGAICNIKDANAIKTSKAAEPDGTALSLVTTGEKAIWNGKTSNTGTITGIMMNGVSKGTSGIVDLGTVITAHQDISGKLNANTKGMANGVAELDANGKVPVAQLPVDTVIAQTTTDWLDENISQPAEVVIDKSLSIEGAAADAKAVGGLKSAFNSITSENSESVTLKMNAGYIILGSTGVPTTIANTNYYVSDPVDITKYSKLKVTARANYGGYIYAFYDSSDAFISGVKSNGTESSTQLTDEIVNVPENAKYIRLVQTYEVSPVTTLTELFITLTGLDDVETEISELSEEIEANSEKVNSIISSETYTVDYIESPTYESGYVNKSGASGTGNYIHTEKISVSEGDRFYVRNTVSGNSSYFRFITAYNNLDQAIFASGGENATEYTVPAGIVSVILTLQGTTGSIYAIHHVQNVTDAVLSSANKSDILFGKKWCVVGDSFTFGGQSPMPVFDEGRYKGSRKSYPYFIGNRTYIDIVDFSANGRTLAYPSDGTFNNSFTNPSADCYYQNIPADVDYITIYLGINDSHHASGSSGTDGEDVTGVIPIGTIDDTTTATFGGAWNVVLSWLITNRPNAHIGIIVSNGVDNVNYRNMTIDIAKKYGLAYLDLNGDDRTPAMLRTVSPNIAQAVKTALINKWAVEVGVNTHPNTNAHEYESYFIENFLRSI